MPGNKGHCEESGVAGSQRVGISLQSGHGVERFNASSPLSCSSESCDRFCCSENFTVGGEEVISHSRRGEIVSHLGEGGLVDPPLGEKGVRACLSHSRHACVDGVWLKQQSVFSGKHVIWN